MGYVQVDDLLTYETDLALQVGDIIELPPAPWMDGPWRGRVTALGRGSYTGQCKQVLRLLERPNQER